MDVILWLFIFGAAASFACMITTPWVEWFMIYMMLFAGCCATAALIALKGG